MKAAELRRWIRVRRLRGARGRWSADGIYTVVLSAAFAVLAVATSARGPGIALTVAAPAGAALALWAAATFGPLGLSRPTLMWVATGPVSRRDLLLPRLTAVLGVGGTTGLLTVLVSHAPTAGLLVLAAATGVLLAGVAAGIQITARNATPILRTLAAGSLAAALLMPRTAALAPGPAVTGVVVAAALLVVVGVVARLDRIRIGALSGDGAATLINGIGTADPGLLTRAAEERRWRGRTLRGRLPARSGGRAIVAHDVLAYLRLPGRVALTVALGAVPVIVAGPGTSPTVLLGSWAVAALLAAGQTTSNVRHDADRPTPARLLGLTGQHLLALRSALPTVVAALWSATALALVAARTGGDIAAALVLGAASGPALAAGALRSARRSLVRHDYPLIVTPMGVVPSGPFLWLAQGPDLALLGSLPLLIALATATYGWLASLIQAAMATAVLAGFLTRRPGAFRLKPLLHRTATVIWRL
ncbi:hypothetical protein GCM10010435_46780 [Winogradskya consettensis]|uniref:Uncharacterized protein n=1 Tax=Winogradskya consettensis TaxID=113560 RepID=A0A919SIT9_9ACTN|nr:DUF6297 family protein [Actinoplanes consettensis]GIM72740.1 hypothetical protein Aco04nite_31710 [Actinoplanes consettensis]